jgi:hypothetical protein
MNLPSRLLLSIPLLLLSQTLHSQSLDRQAVLERLIDAYGGEQNVRRLDNVVQEWSMVALMSNRHGTDTRSIRMPDQLKVELVYPDKSEIRTLNGDAGNVVFNDAAAQPARPPQRDAMRLQLMRLYSPLVLSDKGEAVTLVTDEGYFALSLREHEVQADYLVNPDTWRIEKVVGTLNMHGTEMKFLTEYSDFKFVDGVLVHHKENKYAGQVNTAVLHLHNITFDAGLPETYFKAQ